MKFNILFPMAGKATRFGCIFKPFKQISDMTFIELSFLHFKKYLNNIDKVYFTVTEEQYKENNKKKKLTSYFNNINFEIIILKEQTNSQFETIKKSIILKNLTGSFFICDCDHSIDISPMITIIKNKNPDILVPFAFIEKDNNNFDKIILNEKNKLQFPGKNVESNMGVIGCNYMKNIEIINKNTNYKYILKFFESNDDNLYVEKVEIINKTCFGTQKVLNNLISEKKKNITVFCDIDGTIINHEANGSYDGSEFLLSGVKNKLTFLKEKGKIIITTARSKKDMIEKMLKRLDIPYDDIIVGLNSGPRLLINDIKPTMQFNLMSRCYNILRNEGMEHLNFDNLINNDKILKKFKGGSFSETLLVNTNNNIVVRKILYKKFNNIIHYEKLKLQKYNIDRFNCYLKNICPQILNEENNDYYYYYDIEYLKDYDTLYSIIDKYVYFNKLFNILKDNIYVMKKLNNDKNWIENFIKRKINIKKYENLSDNIRKIINMDSILINGINCKGFKHIFKMPYQEYNPKF